MAKPRCETCGQKIILKDPTTPEEAEARMEEMGYVIVQLKPWMLRFFDFHQWADGSNSMRLKPGYRPRKRKKKKDA